MEKELALTRDKNGKPKEIAKFSLESSSKNGFDKVTNLCSNTRGFAFVKIYKDPEIAELDFEAMSDKEARIILGDVWNEENIRLTESPTGLTMLLPIN